jgi:hypothetical protein
MSSADAIASIWKDVFTAARKLGPGPGARYVVLVQKNHGLRCLACPLPGSLPEAKVAEVERIVPSAVGRNIVIIAPTEFQLDPADEVKRPGTGEIQAAGRTIPFFGLVLGLAFIGHCVWVFDGQATALAEGCRGADLLIIDSIKANELTTKSVEVAADVMRNANILIFDRNTRNLRTLRKVGNSSQLEFHGGPDVTSILQ